MPKISAFAIAQEDIEKHFDSLNKKFFSFDELGFIFSFNRKSWRLPKSWDTYHFVKALFEKTDKFKQIELKFPNRVSKRMVWGDVSANETALSLRSSAYLTHYTAMFMHGLTDQISKTVYVTAEQTKKNTRGTLTQKGIDSAFRKPQRVSENLAAFGDNQKIYFLNGQHTNRAGVITNKETEYKITNLERTIIDATVRPLYCGGVFEVLEAYKRASKKISINKLTSILKKINFIYPYHQAIGFYLEKSGAYTQKQINLLKNFDSEFDFYLTYDMKDPQYSKEWKIYYPKNF